MAMQAKIKSEVLPRAFVLMGLLTIVEGCARHAAQAKAPEGNTKAAAASDSDMPFDVAVTKLPHAKLPPLPNLADPPPAIPRDEKIPGVTGDEMEGQYQVTGVADRGKALATISPIVIDPPDDSYCVGSISSVDRGMAIRAVVRKGSLSNTKPPMEPDESREQVLQSSTVLLNYVSPAPGIKENLVIERADGDKLTVLRAWSEQSGGMRLMGKATVAMRPITSFNGVDVHAFIDDSAPNFVNVVIKRPALKSGRVRAKPIFGTLPDGVLSNSTCRHVRVVLPLKKGDGATATFNIATETEQGARLVRVNVSTLWLASDPVGRVATRVDWDGGETPDVDGRVEQRKRIRRPIVGGRADMF